MVQKKTISWLPLYSLAWDKIVFHYNFLMGMTKPIADDHTSTDDFTPMTRSSDAQVADDHEKTIQCLQ